MKDDGSEPTECRWIIYTWKLQHEHWMRLKIDVVDKHYGNIYYTKKDKDGNEIKKMRMKTKKE